MFTSTSLFSSLLFTFAIASPYAQFGPPGGSLPTNHGPPSSPSNTGPPSQSGFPGGGPGGGPSSGPPGGFGSGELGNTANSPAYTWLYQYPLPIPPIAQPKYTETVGGQKIEYFEITIEAFDSQIYPNLGPTHLVGYNGSAPGPTFKLDKGVNSIVRYLNRGSDPAAIHLHGSPSHAPWDGWASDFVQPGQYKDYYYPNSQAGPLWYHDHSDGITTKTVYFGQAGVHLIHDPAEDVFDLPEGDYDVPLTLMDKAYQSNGELVDPSSEVIDFYGDIIEVNGQPWPYFNVEPRRYRLRIFNMGLSRPYDLSFVDDDNNTIEVQVVASDAGLFEYPVSTNDIFLSMGERYEVVIDFSSYKGNNVTLTNILNDEFVPEYENTDQVMRFVVGNTVSSNVNNGPVPSKLKDVNWPAQKDSLDHVFNFQHGGDDIWTINGEDFDDINNRVLARPLQGAVENWEVVYASGPGVHPVHIHLVNFQIVSRTGGRREVLPYEKAGLKDTVLLDAGETVLLRAVYGPWNGLYTFHCHNLVHEDHMMMDAFNVTLLEELGYRFNSTFDFADPMDPRYAARDYSAAAYQPAAIKKAITSLGNLNAYAPIASIASAEASYYSTAGYPEPSATATALTEPSGAPGGGSPFPTNGAPTGFGGPPFPKRTPAPVRR